MVWLRLSMLKIKHTNLIENQTRNYEKKYKLEKEIMKKKFINWREK